METFQLGADLWPGEVGFKFRNPDQQKSKPAQHDVGSNAVRFGVIKSRTARELDFILHITHSLLVFVSLLFVIFIKSKGCAVDRNFYVTVQFLKTFWKI